MRYYEFALSTSAKYISENARIKLRDYSYEDPIGAMNSYMFRNLQNDLGYFAYREEENCILAVFCYNGKTNAFDRAYGIILEMLDNAFQIKKVLAEPSEITMFRFYECAVEGRRRDVLYRRNAMEKMSKLELCEWLFNSEHSGLYDLEEMIISENRKEIKGIYDKSFIKEIYNIEAHENISEFEGNIVHYIISGKSFEAVSDLTGILAQRLLEAKRISSRRIEIIRNIDPYIYKKMNYLEDLIENNYGGVIVIDLSEKFGYSSVDYGMTCVYIEGLVKKYKNDCLFVFTYNTEKPGFAYQFLQMFKKHVVPVMLREGTGNRRSATGYLKELIRDSAYAKYEEQAGEFLRLFPGNVFSQTDVLLAFEKFEPWCINRNVCKAYDYDISGPLMLDRDEDDGSSYDKLQHMIGLTSVKKQIDGIIATNIVEKERKKRRGNDYQSGTMHMIFSGNPGTAKTTVAKLFAGIAKEKGILKSGAFVVCGGMDLDSICCEVIIRRAFEAAKGGVLFIDEAYSLKGDTAVTVLIQEMENNRDDVIVILAGYYGRMKEFLKINEGLKSRIPYWVDFPDYSVEELVAIFNLMTKDRGFTVSEEAVREARNILEKARYMENFGNGRYVRNLIDHAVQNQSVRLLAARGNVEDVKKKELFLLTGKDVNASQDGVIEKREAGTAEKELEEMIGLSSVKAVIHKAVASFKIKRLCLNKGILKEKPSMHMVFTGNPGTAKTTVARLFAEILKDEKVLPSGNFVEVGRADLVGDHVGATAKLVKKKFTEAQGGVLFIDEAYALCDNCIGGYGDEAINTIVQEMENRRDQVIVIFAGYPEPMQEFLDRNPGMSSRIAFHIEFEDYSAEELCDITNVMLSKKQMAVSNAAMEKLRKIYENVSGTHDFGNGRFVRKMLEEAEMNLAERIARLEESQITAQLATTIEEEDIPEEPEKKCRNRKKIGFCVA